MPTQGGVTKLRASDGKNLGTFSVPGAIAVAFDGENIWVTGYGADTVTKMSKGGNVLAVYKVGGNPIGVAFDGASIWVANDGDGT